MITPVTCVVYGDEKLFVAFSLPHITVSTGSDNGIEITLKLMKNKPPLRGKTVQ